MGKAYEVGVYYFPGYHADKRTDRLHERGWTEWELVKAARPRFSGHHQPKVPLWGYENEADPRAFEKKIDAAADHGINHFLFDWYWYNDGPFLERCLEGGYLGAANNARVKFALMWANHDWVDIHPATAGVTPALHFPGTVTRKTFDAVTDYVIEKYFRHPSYWTLNGAPYFSFYELATLVRGLGGLDATAQALASFRRKTLAAGFPDLHLNAVVWGIRVLPNEQKLDDLNAAVLRLGFTSITSYVWIHHVPLKEFPRTDYGHVCDEAVKDWQRTVREFTLPYHPNVTMGWDASPRTNQSKEFGNSGYPYMATLSGNTPERFAAALGKAKVFLDSRPAREQPRVLNINAWNEWTEGSYLEPDTVNGMGYLEALRGVFGAKNA